MKIALCQLNPTVGAPEDNADAVLAALAEAQGARMAVFPELVLPGYPPLDLVERPRFVDACLAAEARLVDGIPSGMVAVFGNLRRRPTPPAEGRRLENVAVVAERGRVLGRFPKTLLPTYDVFDEARWFEPRRGGPPAVLDIDGVRVGFTVCEDIWNDEQLWADPELVRDDSPDANRIYAEDPVQALVAAGAKLILNLSASPFSGGRSATRARILAHLAARHQVAAALVNTVGANDGLIFDGHSLAARPGGVALEMPGWKPAVCFFEPFGTDVRRCSKARDVEELRSALCLGIADYFRKSNLSSAVIGLSGGIDSALTAALAVRALGKERVIGVGMPSAISSDHSVQDARRLAENLGIEFHLVSIAPMVDAFSAALAPVFGGAPPDVTEENLQSRIRGAALMAVANKRGAVVLGTGNKSEAAMGYATLYGDTIGAISVLADLYKHQVYALAWLENEEEERIPPRTIEKPPSAELRPNQKDSDTLPDYPVLDAVLAAFIERRRSAAEIAAELSLERPLVEDIVRRVYQNEFKRKQLPPALRVCRKAWVGRVYPVAQRFRE